MSDFLFSDARGRADRFAWILSQFAPVGRPAIKTWEGPWGSLAVSTNHYQGYEVYEDDRSVCVVVGGPLQRAIAPSAACDAPADSRHTCAVMRHFFNGESGNWHSDLLGPFCVLHIDKFAGSFSIVTDNLSFIPAYLSMGAADSTVPRAFSTHSDAAAFAVCQDGKLDIDPVSVSDFILHAKITYPHTMYRNVRELAPATIHNVTNKGMEASGYWRPSDAVCSPPMISEAAREVSSALQEYLEIAANQHDRLCFLLSAGEDSRTLTSMAPAGTKKHCITVAPYENREARIAHKVANALGASWEFVKQPPGRYLQDLSGRALLSGSNGLSIHAHLLGIIGDSSLADQPAVIGGFGADAFLKGHFFKTRKAFGILDYHQFVANRDNIDVSPTTFVDDDIRTEIESRRKRHAARMHEFRTSAVNEWMTCWPMSQDHEIVNLWSNRRLFVSREAFMCPRILDVASSLPAEFVINRRLFQKMAAPHLGKTRWLAHGEGHFPAFPWYANIALRPAVRALRRFKTFGKQESSPFSWPSRESWVNAPLFERIIAQNTLGVDRGLATTACAMRALYAPDASALHKLASAQVLAVVNQLTLSVQDLCRSSLDPFRPAKV